MSRNGYNNITFRGKIDSLNSALLISKRRYSGAKIALHFRSQNGCDNSTFRGRIDSLNSAQLISNVSIVELKWPFILGAETVFTTVLLGAESTF